MGEKGRVASSEDHGKHVLTRCQLIGSQPSAHGPHSLPITLSLQLLTLYPPLTAR